MNYIYPTERQVVRALLNAIATHPDVVNANVYYPLTVGDGGVVPKVPLISYRTFAGTEYIEDGLTLAIYPVYPAMGLGRAITYTDMTLGSASNSNYRVEATLRLVVHLYYREPTYNAPAVLYSDTASKYNDIINELPYGRKLQFKEKEVSDAVALNKQLPLSAFVKQQQLQINILPGEEILRDWMCILRAVIRDIPTLQPFAVRNPSIKLVEYETPNWQEPTKNLVFHSAYMVVEYKMYEPPKANEFRLPEIAIDTNYLNPPEPPQPEVIPPASEDNKTPAPSCPPLNSLLV